MWLTHILKFPLTAERTLYVQMTHPRILYLLGFLVSSVSKRNPVGRKPKRKVFATEGLTIAERELKKEIIRRLRTLLHRLIFNMLIHSTEMGILS